MQYTEYQEYKKQIYLCKLLPTESDIEGPFYKEGAPFTRKLTERPNLFLSGKVLSADGQPIENVLLDFWQADAMGQYDNEGYSFRGKQLTDKQGTYCLETVVPGNYQIGEDEYRCAHLHVKLSAKHFKPLTTQLYFIHDEYNEKDHWFSKNRLIINEKFNFVLEKI